MEGGDGQDNRVRDLLGLVKFCLNTTAQEDPTNGNLLPEQMDPERRAWLQEALNSMTIDVVSEMVKNLTIIKQAVEEIKSSGQVEQQEQLIDAIDYLIDLCDQIDYAQDYTKLNGFEIFPTLLQCNHVELQAKACDLIAALTQNNPFCQEFAADCGLLSILTKMIDNQQQHIKARVKCLYAISSIVRSNDSTLRKFDSVCSGLSVLVELLQIQYREESNIDQNGTQNHNMDNEKQWWQKLHLKTSFLVATLCSESTYAVDTFFRLGLVEKTINSLKTLPHDETHEYLLSILLSISNTNDAYKGECLRSEYQLVPFLNERQASQNNEIDENERDIINQLKETLETQ